MKAKPIVMIVEIATLNLEEALERYVALYQNRKVKITSNFATRIRAIWQRNWDEIKQTARNPHCDTVAIIPGKVKLPEFHRQMTQGHDSTLGIFLLPRKRFLGRHQEFPSGNG